MALQQPEQRIQVKPVFMSQLGSALNGAATKSC